MTEKYDPFYFSRSDLSDEEKLRIMNERLALSIADSEAGRVYPLDEVIDRLIKKYSSQIKQAS